MERPNVPMGARLQRLFRRTRQLDGLEWALLNWPTAREIRIRFFAPRIPTEFEMRLHGPPGRIVSLEYGSGNDATPMDFAIKDARAGEQYVVVCVPTELRPTTRATIRFKRFPEEGGSLHIRAIKRREHDRSLIETAGAAADRQEWQEAVDTLLDYSNRYSADNAAVCAWIGEWSGKLGHRDTAEEFAARASGHGNPEVCDELYRSIREQRPVREVEDLRGLQRAAADWSIGPQHGLVVLERDQRHVLGLGGYELRKVRETFEVKRPAAARMLGQLEFSFSDNEERPLYTRLTVIHADDQVEKVPLEHFTVTDHRSNNIFITMDNEKAGHWILPDLTPGDVIEWEYDLLHRSRLLDDEPQTFSLSSLFHAVFPTFRARQEFVSPQELPVRFSVRNGELASTRSSDDSRVIHAFSGERFVPAKQTGFEHENLWLNPLIACSTGQPSWTEVARCALRTNFGSAPIEEQPPAPLAELLDGVPPEEGLEKAFYWIRDRLRYAAMHSAIAHIGKDERARRIVEAGVGDCKDRSYLLAVVCRRLGIPYEFVCVRSGHGLLVEEMPADQFNHVFLRVKVEAGWLYLDPANPFATFGSPPVGCQGLSALVLGDPARIIEIPVDPPSANRLEFREVFDAFQDGRVAGRFRIEAQGPIARLADERWKITSLTTEDPLLAGQEALGVLLPGALVDEYRRGAETSASSRFHVEGSHSRGPLTVLGRDRRAVLPLSWEAPTLPIPGWRALRLDRLFVAFLVLETRITVRFEGEVRKALGEVSRVTDVDNPVVRVAEEVSEDDGALEIRRTMAFRRRIVQGEETRHLAPGFEHLERALQMVIECSPDWPARPEGG